MKYNFDEIIDRSKISKKWNPKFYKEFYNGKEDLLPLWVADMDFKTPAPIRKKLGELLEHGILGYTGVPEETYEAIISWNKRRKNIEIKKEWIVFTHGVVPAINFMIQTYTKQNDAVMIQTPVYGPFRMAIKNNNRKVIQNRLINNNGYYEIDFHDFEEKIVKNNVKLFILCSPHNPVGRVWKEEELIKIGEICKKHNVIIVADEIHSDLIYDDSHFTSFLKLKEFMSNLIVCTSPTKTFNVAGVQTSIILIPSEKLRDMFNETIEKTRLTRPNTFGLYSIIAGYNECEEWLMELIKYLDSNRKFIKEYLDKYILKAKYHMPEGTYLAWIDLNDVLPKDMSIEEFFEDKCKMAIDYGYWFGSKGKGFIRLNFACPKMILKEALDRIYKNLNE